MCDLTVVWAGRISLMKSTSANSQTYISHLQPLETCVQAGQNSAFGLPGEVEEGEVPSVAFKE